jgi:hypothetical protein
VAAVVFTTIPTWVELAVPFAVTEAGENVHVASDGSPVQVRVIVPVKLVEVARVTNDCPLEPGAETVTVELEPAIDAENPGLIVNDCDCAVLLGLKLPSPL